MTKKDYIALAAIIRKNTILWNRGDLYVHLLQVPLVDDLCKFLKSDNPNFDEVKFRKAIS